MARLHMDAKVVKKVWGHETWLYNGPDYCMKELRLLPDFMSSVHYHARKRETFLVTSGSVLFETMNPDSTFNEQVLYPGEFVTIEPGSIHRFRAQDRWPATVIEASSHHDDADVYRLEESGKCQ